MIEIEVTDWEVKQSADSIDTTSVAGGTRRYQGRQGLQTKELEFTGEASKLYDGVLKRNKLEQLLLIDQDDAFILFENVYLKEGWFDTTGGLETFEVRAEFSDFEMFSDKNEVSKKLL